MRRSLMTTYLVALCWSTAYSQNDAPQPIPGIGPVGKIVKLHTGLQFTEGPAADAQGNVYFSDIPAATIFVTNTAGKLERFSDASNHANGLMFNAAGELVACEMDGRLAAWDVMKKERRVLVETFGGKRFNAPNDLVIDREGGVYFTDPEFRSPTPLPQGKTAVYYVAEKGEAVRLIDNLPNPNGVLLSTDEKTLYVFPSGQADMMAYTVESPGKIGPPKVFCRLAQPGRQGNRGADGATIDSKGNLYITSDLGLQVFDPTGKALGTIPLPEKPANVTFGGTDMKSLYVTARTSLYTVPMAVQGHRYPAGAK